MRALLFICLAWMAGTAVAQTAADTVRISVETSSGANIGLDGDMSSTNLLTEKVALGKHKVTVQYGPSFTREYDIEVKAGGQRTFSFPIDGSLKLTSTPSGATVYVDGMQLAETPGELKLLGDHNLRVVKDPETYYEITERVRVNPFEQLTREYNLVKRPPRLYGMVMANWSPAGVGGFLGMCRRFGAYARFSTSIDGMGFGKLSPGEGQVFTSGNPGPGYYHKDKHMYGQMTAGMMMRCLKFLYAYVGAGYGEYAQGYLLDGGSGNSDEEQTIYPYGAKGCAVDIGVIFKWKALLVSGGYSTIVGSSYPDGTRHNDFYVGIGFTIHKRNRR